MKIKLSEFWFDPNAVRRRAGIVYDLPDSMRDQLPSDTQILNDKLDVVETVGKKKAEPKQVVSVEIVTDADAKVEVDENKSVDPTKPVAKPSENAVPKTKL